MIQLKRTPFHEQTSIFCRAERSELAIAVEAFFAPAEYPNK